MLSANGNYVFPSPPPPKYEPPSGPGSFSPSPPSWSWRWAPSAAQRRSSHTGIVLFVLPFIVSSPLSSGLGLAVPGHPSAAFAVQGTLPHFAQVTNAYTMPNGYYPLGPWAGLAVLSPTPPSPSERPCG